MLTRADVIWLNQRGVPCILRLDGASMAPTLCAGERVRIEPPRHPRRGDVVAIAGGERTVVHRLVSVRGRRLGQQGDASWHPVLMGSEQVIGHVVAMADGSPLPKARGLARLRGLFGRLVCLVEELRGVTA